MEAICEKISGDEDSDSDSSDEILDGLEEYPAFEYSAVENFSKSAITKLKSAITKLSERLKGEEKRNAKISVYLGVFIKLDPLSWKESWLEVDASDDLGRFSLSCIDYYMLKDMPPELKELTYYGRAVWRSKIVLVGGRPRILTPDGFFASDKVFMYDLDSKKWETQQMNFKRRHLPTIVVAGDNLFVFGGHPEEIHPKDEDETYLQALAKQWAEIFDPDTKSWTCLPTPEHIAKLNHICDHVVCPNQHLILFWMLDWRMVSFNYEDRKWDTYGDCTPIPRKHQFSAKAVVLEDFLFWNDDTTIYAYDLCGCITLPVCTLPYSFTEPSNSFLVHIGKGRLCIFRRRKHNDRIWYITFLVKVNWGVEMPTIHLVVDRTGFLNTPNKNICIQLALGISSGESTQKCEAQTLERRSA